MYTERASERVAVVGYVPPLLRDNTTVDTEWIDMKKFRRVKFYFMCGGMDITADFTLRSATDGSGTGAANITGKAVTQFTATDDNKLAVVEITQEELAAVGATRTHVSGRATAGDGVSGVNVCVLALGFDPVYSPAVDDDLAAVKEIIA